MTIVISWLKLDVNILDDAKIKIIRSHPNGDAVIVLWIGLLCLAMKSQRPGIIEISDGLPYTPDDLSNMFSIEKKTVEMAIVLFTKYRMVNVFDDGSLEVINFQKHQMIEQIERNNELTRIRMIKYRERLKNSDAPVTRNAVTVTMTDLDLDLDKKKKNSAASDSRSQPASPKINFNFKTSTWENITPGDIEPWKEAYPACDISVELKAMAEWLLSNPEKRKEQYRRFITNWLSRQQQRGGTRNGNVRVNQQPTKRMLRTSDVPAPDQEWDEMQKRMAGQAGQ